LNVVPRTNGEAPKAGFSVFADGGGKAVSVSMDTSGAAAGFDAKMLGPFEDPKPAKPPLLAKLANPPVAGAALLPKTFCVPALANPV
jgi:hypothetical protein